MVIILMVSRICPIILGGTHHLSSKQESAALLSAAKNTMSYRCPLHRETNRYAKLRAEQKRESTCLEIVE